MSKLFSQPGDIKNKTLTSPKNKEVNVFEVSPEEDQESKSNIENPISQKRLFIFGIGIIVVLALISARLFQLQIIQGEHHLSLADDNRIRAEITRAARGIIYDKDKKPLIENLPSFDLVIIPNDLPNNEKEKGLTYKTVSKASKISVKNIQKTIEEKGLDYQDPILIKENINRDEALLLETKLASTVGVKIEKKPTRRYLESELFAHLIGYTGKINEKELNNNREEYTHYDYIGRGGLEDFHEGILKGQHGEKQIEVDSSGKTAKVISETSPIAGENLILTIKTSFQKKITEFLNQGIREVGSQSGVVIALNPQTGEVLGMASSPTFDNNLFAQGISQKDYKNLANDPNKPLFHRAVNGTYPPGSVIKPVTAAAGLQENIINEWTNIIGHGSLDVKNQYNPDIIYNFLCWLKSGHGTTDIKKAIAESCDVFFYTVAGGFEDFKGLGLEKLRSYFHKFGLGKKTEVDLPNEAEGTVPDENWKRDVKNEPWYIGDTYHMAIGQGDLLVTPLQMVNATAAVANGGTLYQPQLVYQVQDNKGKTTENFKAKVLEKDFISPENLQIIRAGMRQTITSGSARNLTGIPVEVAGKTGTAQYANNQKEHAWFTAFAPYDDPEICLVVLIEGGGEGSEAAVPVAQKILKWYFGNK